eukprot:EG_transcript_17434
MSGPGHLPHGPCCWLLPLVALAAGLIFLLLLSCDERNVANLVSAAPVPVLRASPTRTRPPSPPLRSGGPQGLAVGPAVPLPGPGGRPLPSGGPGPGPGVGVPALGLAVGLSVLATAALFFTPGAGWANVLNNQDPRCTTELGLPTSVVTCERFGLTPQGGLLPCQSTENCVSSSSVRSPTQFKPPWDYAIQTTDAAEAFATLQAAVLEEPGAVIVEADAQRYYLHATAPSRVPPSSLDDLEFLLYPKDQLVVHRVATRKSVFVYPLQSIVSDGGAADARLNRIRDRLGWTYSYTSPNCGLFLAGKRLQRFEVPQCPTFVTCLGETPSAAVVMETEFGGSVVPLSPSQAVGGFCVVPIKGLR